jgi:hypothetical protein
MMIMSIPPVASVLVMTSSMTAVRTIIAHAAERARRIDRTISSPRSPASLRAKGSRKIASGLSVSIAR